MERARLRHHITRRLKSVDQIQGSDVGDLPGCPGQRKTKEPTSAPVTQSRNGGTDFRNRFGALFFDEGAIAEAQDSLQTCGQAHGVPYLILVNIINIPEMIQFF